LVSKAVPHLAAPGEVAPPGTPTYYCFEHGKTYGALRCAVDACGMSAVEGLQQVVVALLQVLACRDCNGTGVLAAPPPPPVPAPVPGAVVLPPRDAAWPRRPEVQLVQCLCRSQAADALAAARPVLGRHGIRV
jgi:hypothetical protein